MHSVSSLPFSDFCGIEGYNFDSLKSIETFLEPSCAGPTAFWAYRTASRYKCLVTIGYPEKTENPWRVPSKVPSDWLANVAETNLNFQTLEVERELTAPSASFNYNASLTVDPQGNIVAHYRKSFLYYTDATWSLPSPTGFLTTTLLYPSIASQRSNLPSRGNQFGGTFEERCGLDTAFAICMDLNPQYFTAEWGKRELATHTLATEASVLLVSTAWLTRLPSIFDDPSTEGLQVSSDMALAIGSSGSTEATCCCPTTTSSKPDMDSLTYWLDRLLPLVEAERETTVVIANRVGVENGVVRACDLESMENSEHFLAAKSKFVPSDSRLQDHELNKERKKQIEVNHAGAEPVSEFTKLVDSDGSGGIVSTSAHYAGTSAIMTLGRGRVRLHGILGRGEENVLFADTNSEEKISFSIKKD